MSDAAASLSTVLPPAVRRRLGGWGRTSAADCDVLRPPDPGSVARSLEAAGERGLIARGCGRSYGDTSTNDRGHVIDMTALDAIESFDPDSGSIVCQAGVTMAMLVDRYLADGFVPPVCPGTGYVTIGGAVANDVHGKNHCIDGSFGDYVDWIELLLPTGELRRVTAEDQALFRATIGGIGLTGLITRVGFRMSRIGTNAVRVEERRIHGLEEFFEALETSIHAHKYSVGWVDALARGRHLGRGILMNADPAPDFMTVKKRRPITVPFDLPPATMSRLSMVLFNALYRNRVRGSRTIDVDFRRFVFPLDALLEWNRLYGKAGAVQFQCLVPPDQARPAFRKILTLASESAVASPLAVIKSTGREGRGMLSFGRPGFSLALDFPRRPSTDALIPQLHALTIEHGGRLYLAKDACLTPADLSQMYPEAEQFKALIRKIDPQGIMQSDMARRLGLIGPEGVS